MKIHITIILFFISFTVLFTTIPYVYAEWEKFQIINDGVMHLYPNMTFNFYYNTDAKVINVTGHTGGRGFGIDLEFDRKNNSTIQIKMPKNYPYSDMLLPRGLLTVQNFEEYDFSFQEDCFYNLSFKLQNHSILQLGVAHIILDGVGARSESVPRYCMSQTIAEYENNLPDRPYKQLRDGIKLENITCLGHLNLYIKDGKPLCVKNSTFTALTNRGEFK